MSLNPTGAANYGWNYSNPDKPGYSTVLVGTVMAIQEVQKRGYNPGGQPGAPEFWPDGNPKMNIRLALATGEGELKAFTFQPAGKEAKAGRKKSIHMDLFHLTGDTDMRNLIGKTIGISTVEGHYGPGNPRPWNVGLVEDGPYELAAPLPDEFKVTRLLADNAVSGGQMMPPVQPQYPQYQQVPQFQQPQQFYQQPVQQPQYQQPVPQQVPQMDPNIAQAMNVLKPTSVTVEPAPKGDPVGGGSVYDTSIPF